MSALQGSAQNTAWQRWGKRERGGGRWGLVGTSGSLKRLLCISLFSLTRVINLFFFFFSKSSLSYYSTLFTASGAVSGVETKNYSTLPVIMDDNNDKKKKIRPVMRDFKAKEKKKQDEADNSTFTSWKVARTHNSFHNKLSLSQ